LAGVSLQVFGWHLAARGRGRLFALGGSEVCGHKSAIVQSVVFTIDLT
jgi:hypothetical protein